MGTHAVQPALLALGGGFVGVGGDIGPQRGQGRMVKAGRRTALRQRSGAAGPVVEAAPAPDGRGVNADDGGDLTHAAPGVEGGEGTFTEVAGGLRVAHRRSVPLRHCENRSRVATTVGADGDTSAACQIRTCVLN